MNAVPGIRKYYVGFAVLLILMVGCLLYVLSQAGAAKIDKRTNEAVQKIAEKLDVYVNTKGNVPESLQAVGAGDIPDTIKYTRLDVDRYKICIDYKTASSGFDAGWLSLLGGNIGAGSYSSPASGDRSYFDSTVQYQHKKGSNCQTVKTYVSSSQFTSSDNANASSRGVLAVCLDYGSSYPYKRTNKIQSIDLATHTINIDNNYGTYLEDGSGYVDSPPKVTSLKYDAKTVFYDSSCNKTTDSAVKAGDVADFYLTSASNGEYTDLVELAAQ